MMSSSPSVRTPGFKHGAQNPNFKDGRSLKTKRCKCGVRLKEYRASYCLSCYRKKLAHSNKVGPWHGRVPPPRKGTASNLWRGDKVGYTGIHSWLYREYGKPDHCEGNPCKKISSNFQYALKKGFSYERKRENFMMLCVSCHRIYDRNL